MMKCRLGLILSDEKICWSEFNLLEKIVYNICGCIQLLGVIILPLLGLLWAVCVLGILLSWW